MTLTKKHKRKRLKKSALFMIIATLLFVYILLTIPATLSSNKLKKLGYDKDAVAAIKKQKLTDDILDNKWYSDQLNAVIKTDQFRKDLLPVYLVTTSLTQDDIKLYDKLVQIYTPEQVVQCYQELSFTEMTPLLVFDKVEDLAIYIQDVISHRGVNSATNFELTGTYANYYTSIEPVIAEGSVNMLVNKHFYLSSTYAPANLVEMSIQYATKDPVQFLDNDAYEQFKTMSKAAQTAGHSIYASSTYRDYASQDELYNSYKTRDGEAEADVYSARPGHSEHQTGLTVDLASSTSGLAKFGETEAYQWMLENAHLYGWILRYPEGKTLITGYNPEPWHWRYVGVDLATEVYNSGLTYDEYYMLYLK